MLLPVQRNPGWHLQSPAMPYVSVDITDAAAVEKAITESGVDGVIHCAAWTAVDAAEDEDKQEISTQASMFWELKT